MMGKWAREAGGKVAEFIDFDPTGLYPPELAWVPVPEHLERWATHDYVVTDALEVAPPTLDYLVDQLLAELARRGERIASGGAEMPDGYRVDTTQDGRTLLLGAFLRAQRLAVTEGPNALITWKVSRRQFEGAPASVVIERGRLAIDHIQACIDRECAITAAILEAAAAEDATTASVVAVFDAEIGRVRDGDEPGWPA